MESGAIRDFQISSTGYSSTLRGFPHYARLNGPGAWSAPKLNSDQFIQVNLQRPMNITKIATQGRNVSDGEPSYVEKYSLSYTSDGKNFVDYKIDGALKVR